MATKDKETKTLLLGRYELGKLLGHGTFAKVYQAKNVATNENVAVKTIDKEKVNRVGLNSHIKREISILRRVRHPNIVRLFEVMATKSKIFFVMELVNGGELFDKVVAKGRLKENAARRYFQQVISAVAFCHERGVYHRDLKPENILVDEQGNVKVSDFGLSTVAEQIIDKDGLSHTFCGTPAYVAPEVLARRGYDAAKVDAWSCGVVLFVLVAGYFPFHDKNVMNMYRKICKGEFKCPKWFSSDLIGLLTRLLDVNPVTRITIPEVMNDNVWFKKGFKQVRFYFEDDKLCNVIDVEINDKNTFLLSDDHQSIDDHNLLLRPCSLNAFDIISFSSGFDLSGLFQEGSDGGSRFISDATVSNIIIKLEEMARAVGFTFSKKDCRVSLEGFREGSKGPLIIKVEIFELTPCLRVVEVRKKSGDSLDYDEFCEREIKPRLECLVFGNAPKVDVAVTLED